MRSVPVVLAVAAGIRALGMALRTLVRMVGMTLRFFCQMIGLPLRALRRVLRVALGLLGRVLRLAGQLRRLPLLARHLLLRLAAQARLELLLMAQLLLGGVLLVPLLIRGHVLFVPLGQLRLMLGAASAAFGALVLDARVQLRPAGLDARRARGMICAEIVVEVVAPLAHVLDELGVLLLDAVDEAVALDLEVGKHIVLGVAEQRGQLVRVALQMQQHLVGVDAAKVKVLVEEMLEHRAARVLVLCCAHAREQELHVALDLHLGVRAVEPLELLQLADIVASAMPPAERRKNKNPSRRTFQALRIAVNHELDALEEGLDTIFDHLAPGGRLCVITFHSLEDRLVKNKFRRWSTACTCPPEFPVCVCGGKAKAKLITRKPIEANSQELEENRRSRSAHLRVLEKC